MAQRTFLKRALNGTIASLLSFANQFFQSIMIVPVLLSHWGKEKYGVWLAIYAFFSLTQLLDAGHQTYIGNEFTRYYGTDKKEAQRILASGFLTCLAIGLFEVVATLGLLFSDGGSQTIIGVPDAFVEPDAKWGVLVLVVAWSLAGCGWGLLVKMLLPLGLMDRMLYISLIIRIIGSGLLLGGALLGWSIFNLCVVTALAWLLYCYGTYYYIYLVLPEFFPWWKGADWQVGWLNFRKSLVVTSHNFLDQFSLNGLLIIISNFLGPSLIPLFTTMRTVANTALQGAGIVVQPLHADIIRFHASGEPHKLEQVFVFNWLLTGAAVNTGFLALQLFARPLYDWWTEGNLTFDFGLLNLLIFSVAVANYNRALLIYLSVINHLRSMAYIGTTRLTLVAGISLGGIGVWGLQALAWSLILAEMACTFLSLYFAQQQLRGIGGHLPLKAILCAAAPVCVLGAILVLMVGEPSHLSRTKLLLVVMGSLLLLSSYAYLYQYLSLEVKQRFKVFFNYGS